MIRLPNIAGVLSISGSLLKATSALAASLLVAVQTNDGHPLKGAVVTVRATAGPEHPAAPVKAVMDQIDKAFVPDLLVIPTGSTVEFPNTDSVSHQIYSFSPAKRFQLPLYRGKPYPPVQFEQPGVVVLGCNIHDSMLAYVLVTDAPYFGRADANGNWSVELPRGSYRVTVWHPRMREGVELQREATLADSDSTALKIRLTKPLQPPPLDTHHTWDSY
jgi:plastocyanin